MTQPTPTIPDHISGEERSRYERIIQSPSYRLAFEDPEFLNDDDLRGTRLMLELLKPETIQQELRIESTIVVFGGTRVVEQDDAERRVEAAHRALDRTPGDPILVRQLAVAERILAKAHYYDEARRFAEIVSRQCQTDDKCDYVVVTGGGPGIMEAANRGAFDVGAKSIGLNITLPHEQFPNSYISPELCFQFRYFAIRKMHFLMRAKALVAFPGGFGTMDELFEALTLVQTRKMERLPIILCGRQFWSEAVDFEHFAREGTIAYEDLELFQYAENAEEAWAAVQAFYQ